MIPHTLFLNANGFPGECYQGLFESINTSYTCHNYWTSHINRSINSWAEFLPSVHTACDEHTSLILMGHSIGATLALATAIQMPKIIKGLFLLDPALFLPRIYQPMKLIRALGLIQYAHPMIRLTRSKRTTFNSPLEMFERYSKKEIFQHIKPNILQHITQNSLDLKKEPHSLKFPKALELNIYATMGTLDPYIWKNISALKIPIWIIRPEYSHTFYHSTAKKLAKKASIEYHTIPKTTHLLPFENLQKIRSIWELFTKQF